MKNLIMTFAAAVGLSLGSFAQSVSTESKAFRSSQIVAPYDIEVTYNKTVHVLFPAAVQYVDLGSNDIIAGRASGAENVVRIKSAVAGFPGETNFSVITADGCFYTFNVTYADQPGQLSVEMDDWLRKNELEMTTQVLNKLCELHEAKKHEDLFLMLGKRSVLLGDKDLDELRERKAEQGGWRKFVPFLKKDNSKDEKKSNLFIVGEGFNKKKPVIINEENISQYIFPTCCHAIPGDDIMGYIDNKNRIEIHRRNCDVASRLKASFGNRILDAKWDMHKVMFFDATIELRGIDRKGMLHDISEVISDKLDVNMHRITISSEEGIFDGTIEIRVHDRSEVSVIMDELKKIEDLKEVLQIL